jgi:hypothetical protein
MRCPIWESFQSHDRLVRETYCCTQGFYCANQEGLQSKLRQCCMLLSFNNRLHFFLVFKDFTAVESVCWVSYSLTRDCTIYEANFSLDHIYFIEIIEKILDKMKRRGRNIFHAIEVFCILEWIWNDLDFGVKQIMPIQFFFKSSIKIPLNKDRHGCKDNIQMNATKFSTLIIVRSSRNQKEEKKALWFF